MKPDKSAFAEAVQNAGHIIKAYGHKKKVKPKSKSNGKAKKHIRPSKD